MSNLDHSLASISLTTDNNIGIFISKNLVILPAISSNINRVNRTIKQFELSDLSANLSTLYVQRNNGVYSIDITQLKKLCMSNESRKL